MIELDNDLQSRQNARERVRNAKKAHAILATFSQQQIDVGGRHCRERVSGRLTGVNTPMSEFLLKPRICFGQGAFSALSELSARSTLLVTDKAMVKFGLPGRVTALLCQRGIAWQVWDDVVADPNITTVVRGMKLMDTPLSADQLAREKNA